MAADVAVFRCECGGPLSPVLPDFDPGAVESDDRTVWRYRAMLPLTVGAKGAPVTLGEGGTPHVALSLVGMPIQFKLEFLQPTGSYKDRGSAVLATALAQSGPRVVVEDSSGNAGASMAAYLGRANIGLQLFVPQDATSGALRQAEVYGAVVDQSASTRLQAAQLAMDAVSKTQLYASHVYSPYFMAGVATMAYEIWEDMGHQGPANVVLPIGQGVLLLGLYRGFLRLKAAGLIKRLPKFFGVQSRACAPIYDAFNRGADATIEGI
ncbi:MAG: pyridoxal-phosphate dependent enzyme, partial [Anaerolineae bacterium]